MSLPTRWYHGTEADPEALCREGLRADMIGHATGGFIRSPGTSQAFWFSHDPHAAGYFGCNMVAARLDLANPLDVTEEMWEAERLGKHGWIALAKARGHDAVVFHDFCDGDSVSTVAAIFAADQVLEMTPYRRYDEEADCFVHLDEAAPPPVGLRR